jgi:hypothetical protein
LAGEIAPGVHAAPHEPVLLAKWLGQVQDLAQYMARINHLNAASGG